MSGLAPLSKTCSDSVMDVQRPANWPYPARCHYGHEWAPGRVSVGWRTCSDCEAARANDNGHRWVSCRNKGCLSIWYDPPYTGPTPQLRQV